MKVGVQTNGNIEAVTEQLDFSITFDAKGNEKSRKVVQSVRNYETVLTEDSRFAGRIKFNDFTKTVVVYGAVPWDVANDIRAWTDWDDSEAYSLIQTEYGLSRRNDFFDAMRNISNRNKFHPVRDKLDSLTWDEKEYIKNLLSDYLGADPSKYNAEVMLLFMLGLVSRAYTSGCKFDYCLILRGAQGIRDSGTQPQVRINAIQLLMNQCRSWTEVVDILQRLDELERRNNE